MSYHTTEPSNAQDPNSSRVIGMALFLIGALALALALGARPNAAPQQQQFFYPDPTPYVVETTRIEIFSNNRFCVGGTVQC